MALFRIRRRESGLPNDVEMLQTDIMRFLAIICMCLMILFALVQTMPLTGKNTRPSLQSPDLYERRVQALRNTIDEYKAELKELQQKIEQRKKYLKNIEADAGKQTQDLEQFAKKTALSRQKLKQAEVNLAEVKVKLRQSEQSLDKAESLLAQKQNALKKTQSKLHRTEDLLEKRRQSLEQVEDKLYSTQADLTQARKRLQKAHANIKESELKPETADIKTEPILEAQPVLKQEIKKAESAPSVSDAGKISAKQAESKTPAKQESAKQEAIGQESVRQTSDKPPEKRTTEQNPAKEQEGFTLTFADEKALHRLISNTDLVSMYLIAGGRSWCLKAGPARTWKFIKTPAPPALYEMHIDSVPYMIRRAGKKVVSLHKSTDIFYGVNLAPGINKQIQQVMTNRIGGDIVIKADGSVGIH